MMGGPAEISKRHPAEILDGVGLRPTRQRLFLAGVLFAGPDRHVTAEQLHSETRAAGARISLATVYNTLHQFTRAGLLREVVVDAGRAWFDTNTRDHHHFYLEETGTLVDIPGDQMSLAAVPAPPGGEAINRIDIVIRLRSGEEAGGEAGATP